MDDRHEHHAEHRESEEGRDGLRPVGELEGHHVAGSEAPPLQARGEPSRLLVHVTERRREWPPLRPDPEGDRGARPQGAID